MTLFSRLSSAFYRLSGSGGFGPRVAKSYPKVLGPRLVGFVFLNQVRRMSVSMSEKFEDAKKRLNLLKEDPGNDVKLKLYGLFKQATVGPCNAPKPGAFDFVGKAKWEAWNSLGNISQDEAMSKYINVVDGLVKSAAADASSVEPAGSSEYEGITYKEENNITRITFSRPAKKNAITIQMYKDISSALKRAGENDTAFTVIAGQGDYYCSGNDLSNFSMAQSGDVSTLAKNAGSMLKDFVAAFIDFPKPLIAAVNGPAVGIPVTLLGLFDAAYASDKATFYTPFSLLGQSPEACATYTFPKIMGYAKANDMLMFNKKITAFEAKELGLISDVFPHDTFQDEVENRISSIASASKQSLKFSKQLMRDLERDTLHRVNAAECERLIERWQSPDCMEAIMNFFQRKGKL